MYMSRPTLDKNGDRVVLRIAGESGVAVLSHCLVMLIYGLRVYSIVSYHMM